jgi:hypothetical protein
MFYKSSILTAIFVLISIGNAIAADLSNIENLITEQQLELVVNVPNLPTTTPKNSASIAKARLLRASTTNGLTEIELKTSIDSNSANIAKVRLQDLFAKESSTLNTLPLTRSSIAQTIEDQSKKTVHPSPYQLVTSTSNQSELNNISAISSKSTKQSNIASASSELNLIEQWEINKSVTLTNMSLTPVPSIAQIPERLPDNSIPSPVIETAKPAIVLPTISIIGTQKPVTKKTEAKIPAITPGINDSIAQPTAVVAETKQPELPKSSPQVIEAQKTAPQNNEPKKWAVGVHTQFSTTGFIGVDAGYKFSPNLHARLGLNTVGFNLDYASQGINYKANFNPTNIHLLGDFFPFGGGLRLTGGLVFQNNQFNATGTPNSSAISGGLPSQINLGGSSFNINDVGTVSSEGSFSNSVAPYLGIGFGTPLSPGLGFNFDAGVMFAGSPRVRLRANNIPSSVPIAIQDQIRTGLAEQERRTNNDISSFGVFPVISVGLSYAF